MFGRRRRLRLRNINHESSRKAFETRLAPPFHLQCGLPISITNLAERHLRLETGRPSRPVKECSHINHESSRKAFETAFVGADFRPVYHISITNLAERHLRPGKPELFPSSGRPYINHESSRKAFETPVLTTLPPYHYELDINHESSRKAFETGWVSCLDDRDGLPISITNLAERHLRLLWSLEPPPRQCRISITNLAERHLRLMGPRGLHLDLIKGISITNLAERHLRLIPSRMDEAAEAMDINHESSRKAFETGVACWRKQIRVVRISITNLAERHLRRPYNSRRFRIHQFGISITNLAERHLRLAEDLRVVIDLRVISITNLAERHLRPSPLRPVNTLSLGYINHESSRKAFETEERRTIHAGRSRGYQSRI